MKKPEVLACTISVDWKVRLAWTFLCIAVVSTGYSPFICFLALTYLEFVIAVNLAVKIAVLIQVVVTYSHW